MVLDMNQNYVSGKIKQKGKNKQTKQKKKTIKKKSMDDFFL